MTLTPRLDLDHDLAASRGDVGAFLPLLLHLPTRVTIVKGANQQRHRCVNVAAILM